MEDRETPPFYIGTGGREPGIFQVSPNVKRVCSTRPGASVYGLCLSPTRSRLMAGMRDSSRQDQVGEVRIWELNTEGIPDTIQLKAYQEAAVTSATMVTDVIGVTGGVDGRLRCWDTRHPNEKPTVVEAHEGPVLALERLSSQIIMSIGQDGRGRVWDLDRLECVQEFLDPGSSYVGGLLGLAHFPQSRMVVGVYPSGTVLIHSLGSDEATTHQVPVVGGEASALTLAGSRLVVAEKQGKRIRSVPMAEVAETGSQPSLTDPKGEAASTRKPVLSLEAITTNKVVVAFRDERASLWHVRPSPTPVRELEVYDARSVAAPPRREQFARGVAHSKKKRDQLLKHAREQLDSRRISSLKPNLMALSEEGMDVEALVLLAEWANRNERPLWELRARLHLAKHLPTESWCAVHYYALGQLLERLHEPDRARTFFEQVEQCQPGFRNAHERAARLPDRDKPPSGSVVDDFLEVPDQAVFEAKKHAILGKRWTFLVTLDRDVKQGGELSANQVLNHLETPENWRVQERTIASNGRVKSLRVLERRLPRAGDYFVFGVSFGEPVGERVYRVWIDPRDENFRDEDLRSVEEGPQDRSDQVSSVEKDQRLQTKSDVSPRIENCLQKMSTAEYQRAKERARKELNEAIRKIGAEQTQDRNVL